MKRLFLLLFCLFPVLGLAQKEPKGAKKVRTQVIKALEKHQFNRVLDRAEPGHRETQMGKMGQKPPQYIAELFDIYYQGNNIDVDGKDLDYYDLERIKKVTVSVDSVNSDKCIYRGSVSLTDGSSLNLSFTLQQIKGKWWLIGAVG